VLIGVSFIITKKGLIDTAKRGGLFAKSAAEQAFSYAHSSLFLGQTGEGYDYLNNPLWWAGTVTSMLG
jgi:hypothetical protein